MNKRLVPELMVVSLTLQLYITPALFYSKRNYLVRVIPVKVRTSSINLGTYENEESDSVVIDSQEIYIFRHPFRFFQGVNRLTLDPLKNFHGLLDLDGLQVELRNGAEHDRIIKANPLLISPVLRILGVSFLLIVVVLLSSGPVDIEKVS